MLGAGQGRAASTLGQEGWALLRPVMKTAGPHTSRFGSQPPAGRQEGPLVHGQRAVVPGHVQREVVGGEAVLEVVEGSVRILEPCRGSWVSGERKGRGVVLHL
ncbi:hypothetical protein E2C01_076944 [Portunus trituberculatus]|uniref:Uncharacterized protein n=1 Tax=Portunus trituberculatus TaxID=210409 RepID=A0A5B7IKY9_PORTR|nr:hypothetical protein [Portunus trituberculatus]